MTGFHIDLEWWRHREGYQLVDPTPSEHGPVVVHPVFGPLPPTILSVVPAKPLRVVGNGPDLVAYRPFELKGADGLTIRFANDATSPTGVLEFIGIYGPLTSAGLSERGEPVAEVIKHAQSMREFLTYGGKDVKRVAAFIGPPSISVTPIVDAKTGAWRLRYCPKSLLDALWWQVSHSLAEGATVKACRQCGDLFTAGPGTKRRLDAAFCCDAHRITYNSLNRNKEH